MSSRLAETLGANRQLSELADGLIVDNALLREQVARLPGAEDAGGRSGDLGLAQLEQVRGRVNQNWMSCRLLRGNGTWRSLVAHLTGGQGVAGSNPAVPTIA